MSYSHKTYRTLSYIRTCVLLALFAVSLSARAGFIYTVTAQSGLNVRQNPSTDATVIGKLAPNSDIEVVEIKGDWAKITYKGKTGYVSKKYITFKDTVVEEDEEDEDEYVVSDVVPSTRVVTVESFMDKNNGNVIKGQCGDAVYYDFNPSTGHMHIYGSGEMKKHPFKNSMKKQIRSVLITGNVSSIPNRAFYKSALHEIYLQCTLRRIEGSAFAKCQSLASIVIPNSTVYIGDNAFSECYLLRNVTLPDRVEYLGYGAFDGCNMLSSINLPQNLRSIPSRLFNGCRALSAINIPDGVISIGSYAFGECRSLEEIKFPSGLKNIEGGAFDHCNSLKDFKLPSSLTSIGDYAFFDCGSLENIKIPLSVTSIGDNVFYNNPNLTIYYPENLRTTHIHFALIILPYKESAFDYVKSAIPYSAVTEAIVDAAISGDNSISTKVLFSGLYREPSTQTMEQTGETQQNILSSNPPHEIEFYMDHLKVDNMNFRFIGSDMGCAVYQGNTVSAPMGNMTEYFYVNANYSVAVRTTLTTQFGTTTTARFLEYTTQATPMPSMYDNQFYPSQSTYSPGGQPSYNGSQSSDNSREASMYNDLYRRYESQAQSLFNSISTSKTKDNSQGYTSHDHYGSYTATMITNFHTAQKEMSRIRMEAAQHGVNIPQSHWETATISQY